MATITIAEFASAAVISGTQVVQALRGPERRVTQIATGVGDQFVTLLDETALVRISAADGDGLVRWSAIGPITGGNLGVPFALGGEIIALSGGSTIWVAVDA